MLFGVIPGAILCLVVPPCGVGLVNDNRRKQTSVAPETAWFRSIYRAGLRCHVLSSTTFRVVAQQQPMREHYRNYRRTL